MLTCPWAKLPLILDAYQTWGQRYAKDAQLLHDSWWVENCPESSSHQYLGVEATASDGLPKRICGVGSVIECFDHDYLSFCEQWTNNPPTATLDSRTSSGLDIHPLTKIPDSLLTGPWDDEMLDRLFWLIRAGAKLSKSQTWRKVCLHGSFCFDLARANNWTLGNPKRVF